MLLDNCISHQVTQYISESNEVFNERLAELEQSYNSMVARSEYAFDQERLDYLSNTIEEAKTEIASRSGTSKLWFAYQRMVATARRLVNADRAGCWEMHLRAIYDILPIFAAAGQYNYLKSTYLYLQKMLSLPASNPEVHRKFEQGFHVVRRTNKFWCGIGSDLTIEQTLMRSLKTCRA